MPRSPAPASCAEPLRRDAEKTRAKLLDAAMQEFAAKGVSGTRIERIAARAGSNKRMLYYYFGSKEALFIEVLEHAYASIRKAEFALELETADPIEGMRRLIAFTWEYFQQHPEFISLLNSENLHHASHLKKSNKVQAMNSPLIVALDRLLRRGESMGIFRGGVDPLQLYISIAALGYFYLSNRYTLSTIFGRDLGTRRARFGRLQHMQDMVIGFLLIN